MQVPPFAKFAELPLECKQVAVLAQAPVDQSPRMVAQAWMLAQAGAQVHFVAYGNAEDFPVTHPRIHLHVIKGAGRDTAVQTAWPFLRAIIRTTAMTRQLGQTLCAACKDADLLLAQVPPVLPGLWPSVRRDIPLVLDWHNLSAPLAALKLGQRHPAMHFLNYVETVIGRRAQGHFAVTGALAGYLSRRFARRVHELPDRPLPIMHNTAVSPLRPLEAERTWYTVVSPTSWSPDEDMDLLLDAVAGITIPPGKGLRLVVTGKGPARHAFENRAAVLQRPGLRIETAWYSFADYCGLLNHAHCGVSLHRSASGLDFPMKIIDMEAAGLPVLALDYGPALHAGLIGLPEAGTFTDAAGLAARLEQRLVAGPRPRSRPRGEDWPACWSRVALPALMELMS